MEVLLQQMFEGEIDPEDDGPEMDYDDILPDQLRKRKLTLDAVT